jgi:hypothetical protein
MKMNHSLKPSVAQKVGINAALVAQALFEAIQEDTWWADLKKTEDNIWARASYPEIAAAMECMTKSMVATATLKLIKAGYFKRSKLCANKFDHAYWYSLTQAGLTTMIASEGLLQTNKEQL